MTGRFEAALQAELDERRADGTLKTAHVLDSPQGPVVRMQGHGDVLVMSSNDYLGLANHPTVVAAASQALTEYGAGTASVRFICGTFSPHLELEATLADLSGTQAALTYVSCWCANEALIPSISDASTVIFSDQLNHASLIDAIRLARAERKTIYPHADIGALRAGLEACASEQRKLIVTDGVFSMEGSLAPLPDIVDVARRHDAVVVVDDSHGVGVLGRTGRGTIEHFGLEGQVDILTGTLGKALGGAAGGYVAGSQALCALLAQRSRPHLFSNALPVGVAAGARAAVGVMLNQPALLERLRANVARFRAGLSEAGFELLPSDSAIIPIMIGDTASAIRISDQLLAEGVFVTGFGFPVVPEGTARVRVQLSAAHTDAHLDQALEAFRRVGRAASLIR